MIHRLGLNLAGALALGACFSTASLPASAEGTLTLDVEGYDRSHPATLGLEPAPAAETYTVYAPETAEDYAYNHGAVLTVYQNQFYIQWQSSFRDEDAPETRVMYAVSEDGENWSEPRILAEPRDGVRLTNGGWLSDGETLIAFLNIWSLEGTPQGHTEFISSIDGVNWSDAAPVLDASGAPIQGVIEQDSRALPDGRILTSFHMQPGLRAAPYYTFNPLGTDGWTAGTFENLPYEGEVSRELEPSWYVTPDDQVVMVFRDQGGSHQTIFAVSDDMGENWSAPQMGDFPDSRSKQSAGNLTPDLAFRVNNPRRDRSRFPLVLSLSDNGYEFDRAYTIRTALADMPPMLFDGKYKRLGYSYPKSLVHDGVLYIAYATHKERIEITRIPVEALEPEYATERP